MKNTPATMVVSSRLSKTIRVFLAVTTLVLSLASCTKDLSAGLEKTADPGMLFNIPPNLVLKKVMRDSADHKTFSHTQNNLRQIGLAVHNYEDASIIDRRMTYEYDALGRLTSTTHKPSDSVFLFTYDPSGQLTGYRLYTNGNLQGRPSGSARYTFNGAGFLSEIKIYNAGGAHIRSRVYTYHPDGQLASIKYYEQQAAGLIQLGMIYTQHSATPQQVEAWKMIAAQFPEPELPWEILTLLADRIVAEGTIPDPGVPNGGRMKITGIRFNEYNLVATKDIQYPQASSAIHPSEQMSLNYTKVVWD